MRIVSVKTFDGVSIYSKKPVMAVWVALGALAEVSSRDVPQFTEKLLALLPGLREHHCSEGVRGGFVKRLREGTYPAHILEHIVLELQAMLGDDVRYGKTREVEEGTYRIVVGIIHPQTAILCMTAARTILSALYRGEDVRIDDYLSALRHSHTLESLGPSTSSLVESARKRGIPVDIVRGAQLVSLGWGKHQRRMWATISDKTSLVAADIASDKSLTNTLLRERDIAVPHHIIVETLAQAVSAWRMLGKRAVVKPLYGHQGKGVTVGVRSVRELDTALRAAQAFGKRVLIEQQISGREYRLLVVDGKLVAASERIPAYVRGDGTQTVRALIDEVNRDPRRGDGHTKQLTKISVDRTVIAVLAKAGYTLESVPRKGEVVYLRHSANLSTGGTAVDVTDIVHESTRRMAEEATAAVGLDIAGVDIIAYDIAKRGATVIEVNAAPGIRMHHSPDGGRARDAAGAILDYLMEGTDGRVPIVAVTGTNGKTTVTRLIAHIWRQTGKTIGMTSTGGIYLGEECLAEGDTTGPKSAKRILVDKRTEGAVLETARGGIVRSGLAFDRCDIGIVTNVTDDHLGQDGITSLDALADVKSLIAETVKKDGYVIINADDAYAEHMIKRAGGTVVLVSMYADNRLVRRYLGAGGIAFYLQGGTVWKAQADREEPIVSLREAPITLGGRVDHQMQNCLIACAGAVMLGLSHELVKNGILSFTENKGRMTMIDLGSFTAVLDYGHNPAGYLAVISAVRKLGAKHLVGVIGAAGDRTDDTLLTLGRIAGKHFDKLYIKEDRDLRGRAKGETATILAEGARQAGAKVRDITLLLDERTAIRRALDEAQAGDTIVIFYEDYDGAFAEIERKRGNMEEGSRDDIAPDGDKNAKTFDFSNKNAPSRQANAQLM